jgi:hypothetical protein
MGLILVKNNQEEDLMLALLKEFGSKLILPRNANTNEFFKKYAAQKIFGILDVVKDECLGEFVYELALPDHYCGFITYMIHKKFRSPGTT